MAVVSYVTEYKGWLVIVALIRAILTDNWPIKNTAELNESPKIIISHPFIVTFRRNSNRAHLIDSSVYDMSICDHSNESYTAQSHSPAVLLNFLAFCKINFSVVFSVTKLGPTCSYAVLRVSEYFKLIFSRFRQRHREIFFPWLVNRQFKKRNIFSV